MDICDIFAKYPTDKSKYADFYQRRFAGLNPKTLLEIGVLEGGSHYAWKEIFPDARVVGIDIDPVIKKKFSDLEIYIGDQRDADFLDSVLAETGIPDIIIDDGGHSRSMQVKTLVHLYPKLLLGGLYIVEDVETSFMNEFNDYPQTVFEVLKMWINPVDFDGNVSRYKVGTPFSYTYSEMVFEPNICLLRR
jgi:cephalosporin hydroxylase